MQHGGVHITSYRTHGVILVLLLFLTAITITVNWVDVGKLAIAVAMFVACVKATLVLLYFMHLKFDALVFKLFTAIVFLLLVVVFVITFFDYLFR